MKNDTVLPNPNPENMDAFLGCVLDDYMPEVGGTDSCFHTRAVRPCKHSHRLIFRWAGAIPCAGYYLVTCAQNISKTVFAPGCKNNIYLPTADNRFYVKR